MNILLRKKQECGFTLVEALMTVLLFSILFGAALSVLVSGSDSWQANNVQMELEQEMRKAMDWIKDDLRQSGSSVVTGVPVGGGWQNTITFKTASGINNGNIQWSASTTQYLRGGTNNSQLLRQIGVQQKVIAQDMQLLRFRRQAAAPNMVEVNIQVQKATKNKMMTLDKTFEITMRNR